MNTVIKLDSSHKNQFDTFLQKAMSSRPELSSDVLWNSIPYIVNDREIFAVFEDEKILMTCALNYTPNMPWAIIDTVTNIPMDLRKSFRTITTLFNTIHPYTQKKGICSYWILRNARTEKSLSTGNYNTDNYRNMTFYGLRLEKVFKDYDIATRAVIKAGARTGVPLYDYMMQNKTLNYDCFIRELSLKQSAMVENDLERYYTYG